MDERARLAEGDVSGSIGEGDAAVFERLYLEHAPAVHRTALFILGDPGQAQDVVQDVFMRLWRQPLRFDHTRGTLAGYLRLMARSRALDMWREGEVAGRARDRLEMLVHGDEGRVDELPVPAVERRRDRSVVLAALSHLPQGQRQALVLAYWGGLTAREIAEHSGLTVGTVKSRIRLGLHNLRERCERPLAPDVPVAA